MSTPVEIPRSIKEAAEKYAVETDGAFQYAVDWSEVSQIYEAGAQLVLERLVRAREGLRKCSCYCSENFGKFPCPRCAAIAEIDNFLEGDKA